MKTIVFGLDSAPPELVFERLDLPNIQGLMDGVWGELNSTIPPITCPAWMSLATGKNPGKLGFYGFRNRKDFSYEEGWIANSKAVKEETVWDALGKVDKRTGLVGVPQTYPPKPVNGFMITCFLTPDTDHQYTYPDTLRSEVEGVAGKYILDVEGFRTEDKTGLLKQIDAMTEQHCRVVKHFLEQKWDFFMWVEMGPDRIQHGLWKFFDKTHRKYTETAYENAIPDYYTYLDRKVGEMVDLLDKDTCVVVVSDHGAKKMEGCINVNDWLVEEGYLKLEEPPTHVTKLKEVKVNWKETTAWAWGGYYTRVFFNVKGREEHGVLTREEYEDVRDEIKKKLESMRDDRGKLLHTKVFKPEDIYTGAYVSQAPDLIVYFGDLYWRGTESIGHDSLYSFETEVGPDDCVHAQNGIFMLKDPEERMKGRKDVDITDCAPTILDLMGVPHMSGMDGKSLLS